MEQDFAAVVDALRTLPNVTLPTDDAYARRRFGGDALKVNGKIFAMLVRGKLGLKLPARRIDELVTAGQGERFDAGRGRPMREWVTIDPAFAGSWIDLAREALAFVSR